MLALPAPLTRIPNVLKAHFALDIKPKRVYNILDGNGYSVSNKTGDVYIHYPGLKDGRSIVSLLMLNARELERFQTSATSPH